ncbi:hypothetical protein BDY24DRAFT_400992 [Mrakia frigida]|uniref:uncharacterized protein n=1 Tax=Mrakia frigida TaxID=29902 RepID=UPI003FCC1918
MYIGKRRRERKGRADDVEARTKGPSRSWDESLDDEGPRRKLARSRESDRLTKKRKKDKGQRLLMDLEARDGSEGV